MLQQKILIVEDEKILAELVSEALLREGYCNVEKACNGEEGFEKYKSFSPDLVLMDIEMPVMDGYRSSSLIKSFDPEAKILVITGDICDDRARRTLKEGFALKLLEKPLKLIDLRRVVRENLPALSQAS